MGVISGGKVIEGGVTRLAHQALVAVEDLAAGADVAARAVFKAPSTGAVLTAAGLLMQGASAGVDDANTAVVAIADGAGNAIVSKTYNTATQPPAANAYGSLGSLDAVHQVLAADEIVTLAVTQGPTADLPAFLLVLEWHPSQA